MKTKETLNKKIWKCNSCKEEYSYEPVFCNDCGIEFIANKTFSQISEKSTRELALEWWNNLPFNSNNTNRGKTNYTVKYYSLTKRYTDLTDKEIEDIWKKETGYELLEKIAEKYGKSNSKGNGYQGLIVGNINMTDNFDIISKPDFKSNHKQFKKFNPELFKAYIDKFSDEDKIKALEVIIGINVFSTPKEEILEKIENLLK